MTDTVSTQPLGIEALGIEGATSPADDGSQPKVDMGAWSRKQLDMPQLRKTLSGSSGQQYWRSLGELADSSEFRELLEREFPENASEWNDGLGRRNFMKLMGASLAFGGLTACTIQPEEKIVPWVRAPENALPGQAVHYATAIAVDGVAVGLLAESHMGRPTKLDGNPEHPASLGASHPTVQASILDLYDPDRSQTIKNAGRISTWGSFIDGLAPTLAAVQANKGAGLRILTGSVTSPTLGSQLQKILKDLPEARWHQYDAAHGDAAELGARQAFGESTNTYYDLSKADVLLSLDADVFLEGPAAMRYARDFMQRRTTALHGSSSSIPNRLYVAETSPSSTGSIADHRVAMDSGMLEAFAAALAARLGVKASYSDGVPDFEDTSGWLDALVDDLQAHRGSSAIVVGPHQSPALHALGHALNHALGNVGQTVHHTQPVVVSASEHSADLGDLVLDMKADQVQLLVILGGNPVYDAPAALDFAGAMEHVGMRAHLGPYEDETANLCHWHVPQSHFLESWSDLRAHDGTVSVVQPLIRSLYPSRSVHEVVAVIGGEPGTPVLDMGLHSCE